MRKNDGRSMFAKLYLSIALVSLFMFDQIMNRGAATGIAAAGLAALSLCMAVIFGLAGTFKHLTKSRGVIEIDNDAPLYGEEKRKNSNIEVRIISNLWTLSILIVFLLFVFTRF